MEARRAALCFALIAASFGEPQGEVRGETRGETIGTVLVRSGVLVAIGAEIIGADIKRGGDAIGTVFVRSGVGWRMKVTRLEAN